MKTLYNYIFEKFKISKNTISNNILPLAENLYKRILPDSDYPIKDKVMNILTEWIEANDIKNINRDIFYSYSNKDRAKKIVDDTSYFNISSYVPSYSDLIDRFKLNKIMTSYYKKIEDDNITIYIDGHRLLYIHGKTSVKFVIYMNAWKKG